MNIVLADSNELIRIALQTILKSDSRITIVGEAHSDKELKEICKNFSVDVILIDYTAPNFSIDAIPFLLQKYKWIKFVAITPEQSAQTITDALRCGVLSYVKKDCDSTEIMSAVKETFAGNKFFCGQILESIRKASINVDELNLGELNCEPISISEREQEVITLIAEGHTNAQIADILHLSAHTVNTHRKNIMSKIGVKNTAQIVMYAVKSNLVCPNKFLFAGTN